MTGCPTTARPPTGQRGACDALDSPGSSGPLLLHCDTEHACKHELLLRGAEPAASVQASLRAARWVAAGSPDPPACDRAGRAPRPCVSTACLAPTAPSPHSGSPFPVRARRPFASSRPWPRPHCPPLPPLPARGNSTCSAAALATLCCHGRPGGSGPRGNQASPRSGSIVKEPPSRSPERRGGGCRTAQPRGVKASFQGPEGNLTRGRGASVPGGET